MFFRIIIYFFILSIVSSCRDKSVAQRRNDFINDPDNKILQSVAVGNITVIVKLIPDNLLNTDQKRDDDNYIYFNVKIQPDKIVDHSNQTKLYIDFDMHKDFKLSDGPNDISPAICQKIDNGKPLSYEYLLAFELPGQAIRSKEFTLHYNDQIFGAGNLAFIYNKKDLQKIPGI